MAFCRYCGKQISEPGSCDCAEAQAARAQKAAESAAENVQQQAENTVQNVQQQVENAAQNVQQQAENAAQNVQQQAENTVQNVQQQAENAVQNVQQQAENAAQNIQQQAENAAQNVQQQAENTAQNVQQQVENTAQNVQQPNNAAAQNQNGYKQLSGSDIAKKVDGLAGGISENLPGNMKNNKSLVYIAAGAIVVLLLLMVLVVCSMGNNPSGIVKKYAKATTDKRGGKTYYSLTYPDEVIKELKDDGDYRDLIDEFNENVEDKIDYLDGKETMPKFDKITRKDKLSKSELRRAEEYFEFLYETYDVDADDIDVTKGYEIKYRSKYKDEDGKKRNLRTTIWVVKVKGEGWKIVDSPLAIDY